MTETNNRHAQRRLNGWGKKRSKRRGGKKTKLQKEEEHHREGAFLHPLTSTSGEPYTFSDWTRMSRRPGATAFPFITPRKLLAAAPPRLAPFRVSFALRRFWMSCSRFFWFVSKFSVTSLQRCWTVSSHSSWEAWVSRSWVVAASTSSRLIVRVESWPRRARSSASRRAIASCEAARSSS